MPTVIGQRCPSARPRLSRRCVRLRDRRPLPWASLDSVDLCSQDDGLGAARTVDRFCLQSRPAEMDAADGLHRRAAAERARPGKELLPDHRDAGWRRRRPAPGLSLRPGACPFSRHTRRLDRALHLCFETGQELRCLRLGAGRLHGGDHRHSGRPRRGECVLHRPGARHRDLPRDHDDRRDQPSRPADVARSVLASGRCIQPNRACRRRSSAARGPCCRRLVDQAARPGDRDREPARFGGLRGSRHPRPQRCHSAPRRSNAGRR